MRDALERRGVPTFVDWRNLIAGLPWPEKLERALLDSRAVVVFVGPTGLGAWQTREMYFALDLQTRNADLRVIPVLLAGADPPTGFLALNTWVDLRNGITEATLEPLLRAIDGASVSRPVLDVCPYRDLRAFREEDAALFYGRGDAIKELVSRVDASTRVPNAIALVAAVGPSGSGKSSVVMAGVLPALRRQRPPSIVWDALTFTPGDAPWHRFADALLPLLDPSLSETQRIAEGATLAAALRTEGGITTAITRVLQKSGGTDRLLVIADQFEELFTLADPATAREFVRALLAASRSVPMTVLLTLRSDYYGKAIALDRDLSDALPAAQVNLGPIRREELRDVIEQPAFLAGLTFEPGLVDRILDDVGEEPGNLPLLEYALTELWKARADGLLTNDAYERTRRVAGALAKRANDLYRELSDAQKPAARRLLLRLVRVASAEEEGADTRRRARRSEIDDDAWALVPFFTSARARLLVAGTDVTTGEDTVEVAHEALIRKWDTLRAWLDEDRRFLLWRQQLAVFRAKWIETPDEGTLLRGTLLTEAQGWMRKHRADLSAEERAYIEASAKRIVRSRARWVGVAVAVGMALGVFGAWKLYERSTRAVTQRILERRPETFVFNGSSGTVENLAALVRFERLPQIEAEIAKSDAMDRPRRYAQLAAATGAARIFDQAMGAARATKTAGAFLDVAAVMIDASRKQEAIAALREAEGFTNVELFRLSQQWLRVGEVEQARRTIMRGFHLLTPQLLNTNLQFVIELGEHLVKLGERDRAIALAATLRPERQRMMLRVIEAATRPEAQDVDRWLQNWRAEVNPGLKSGQAMTLVGRLVNQRRLAEAESVALDPVVSGDNRAYIIRTFIAAGALDQALRVARASRSMIDGEDVAETHVALATALAHANREADADAMYEIASQAAAKPEVREDEIVRDEVDAALVTALAARGHSYEALQLAETIEADDIQREALLSILREISAKSHTPPAPPLH